MVLYYLQVLFIIYHPTRAAARAAMALAALSGDEQGILFTQLCNVLEPRRAVYLSSASNELRTATEALRLLQHAAEG